jgi:hypothetical protein
MIRRQMIEQLRNESIDLLENSADLLELDPEQDELDKLLTDPGLVRAVPGAWRALPSPQPPPRQRSTVASEQAKAAADWESFIDTRLFAQFCEAGGKPGEVLRQALAEFIVIEGERHERALAVEVKALRRELNTARAQIEALQGGANKITSWAVDRKNFRVTLFNGSTPGPTLDLRPLFEEYQFQTAD